MTIKNRTIKRTNREFFILIILIVLSAYSCVAQVQTLKSIKYLGLEGSFGSRSFSVRSNIKEINNMQTCQEGGSLGVAFGNELLKTRIKVAGYYYSNANTPRTQELFEVAASTNVYPLQWLGRNSKLQPYITGGLSLDRIKFFGTYLDDRTFNRPYEPLLGKLYSVISNAGVGLEFQFPSAVDFIHLFAEATYGAPIHSSASVSEFSRTSIHHFTSFTFGLSFGRKR